MVRFQNHILYGGNNSHIMRNSVSRKPKKLKDFLMLLPPAAVAESGT